MRALWIMIAIVALTGCATRSPMVQPGVYGGAPGVALSVDLDAPQSDVGMWEMYKGSWRNHPWWMSAAHLGAAAGVYTAGDAAGFWGGSGSRSYSHTEDKSSTQTTDLGSNYNFRVEGDGNVFNFDSGNDFGP